MIALGSILIRIFYAYFLSLFSFPPIFSSTLPRYQSHPVWLSSSSFPASIPYSIPPDPNFSTPLTFTSINICLSSPWSSYSCSLPQPWAPTWSSSLSLTIQVCSPWSLIVLCWQILAITCLHSFSSLHFSYSLLVITLATSRFVILGLANRPNYYSSFNSCLMSQFLLPLSSDNIIGLSSD